MSNTRSDATRLEESLDPAKSRPSLEYLGKFIGCALLFGAVYASLLWVSGRVGHPFQQDQVSSVIQATIGVAVAFAGAWVAIRLATNGERLARTGILLAKSEHARIRVKECTDLIDTTQRQFMVFAGSIRAMIAESMLDLQMQSVRNVYALDRLVRQPTPGFSRYLNEPSYSYPNLDHSRYRKRMDLVGSLGVSSEHETFPGSKQWVPDDAVRGRARWLASSLSEAGVSFVDEANVQAANKLDKLATAMIAVASAAEATAGDLYCRAIILAHDTEVGRARLEKLQAAAESLRSLALALQQQREAALNLLGESMMAVELLFPYLRVLSKLPTPQLAESALWCLMMTKMGQHNPDPTATWGGQQILDELVAVFPGIQDYRAYFQKGKGPTGSAAQVEAIPEFLVPVLENLGLESHLGRSLLKALERTRDAKFAYTAKEEEMSERDLEFEDTLLVRCSDIWLGSKHELFVQTIELAN